jgi:hypothetical protein
MNAKTFVRRSIKFQLLIATGWALLAPSPVFAWNSVGHRAIAELAWRNLDNHEREAISELLKAHPHYQQLLAVDVPKGVATNEWVFLTAAVWPDRVRPAKHGQPPKPDFITKYDLYPHAIGYPFLETGDTNSALLENFYIAKPNAEMVLSNSMATLENPKTSAPDRAVSLCWTLHLMGDLHQPLHTANMVSEKTPGGDHLGGHHIALNSEGKQIDFHSFWDQLGGVDPSYKTVAALADKISADPELKPALMKEYQQDKTVASWVQEGFRIAVNFAYSEKHVQFVHLDDLKSGKISASSIPTMSEDYVSQARKIAHRRIALAGQRLTDELKRIW